MKAGVGLLVVVALGCGDDDTKNNRADAAMPDGPPSMAMIGPEGGSIASADGIATLTIPPGAVAAATAFSIDIVPTAMVPAAITAAMPHGAVYDIKPEGTVFATPATLTWTFSPPIIINDPDRCPYLFGHSYSSAGLIEPHLETEQPWGECGFIVTSTIEHLSMHFLTRYVQEVETIWHEFGSVELDLGGGDYAVGTEWDVPKVALHTDDLFLNVGVRADRRDLAAPVIDISPMPEWFTRYMSDPNDYYVYNGSLGLNATYTFAPQARFKCNAQGMGKAAMRVRVELADHRMKLVRGYVSSTENVNCIVRPEKPEYVAETAALGTARIATAAVPSTQMADVTAQSGAYGYLVTVQAGQTIRVCVTTNGATNVNYFPRYSPGFTFVDGNPGCTDLTNLDTKNPTQVLIKLSGTGTDVDVVITTVP